MESKAVSFMKGIGGTKSSRNSAQGAEINLTDLSAVAPAEKTVVRPRAGRAARELRERQTVPEKKAGDREFRQRARTVPDLGVQRDFKDRKEAESSDEEEGPSWKGAFAKMMGKVKQVAGGVSGGVSGGGKAPLRKRFTVQVRLGFSETCDEAAESASEDEHSAEEMARRESAKQKETRKKEEARLVKTGLHSNPTYMLRHMALAKPQRKGSVQTYTYTSLGEGLLLSAESKQGTKDEVWEAWRSWRSIDADTEGYVEMVTFFRWVSNMGKSAHSKKLWEATAGKSERITLKQFIQALWPKAQKDDLDAMIDKMEQLQTQAMLEVPTPALIGAEERKDLTAVFKSMDADKSGQITVAELVDARFMCREEATTKVKRFSEDGANLSLEHFLEMMTPDGYRWSENATLALCPDGDGTIVRKNPKDGKWYRANLRNKDFLRSLYPERYVGTAAAH
jgi:Ca2+-binding EF-hand superfamily protein